MLECLSPKNGFTALFEYEDDDPFRSWTLGSRFDSEPTTPLQARLKMRKGSQLVELWKAPLPVMSIRLHQALLAAADLAKSNYLAYEAANRDLDFNSLSIDQAKTRSALMFRLAEASNGIVVHESVKRHVESSGIDTLTFLPPENWAG